MARQRFLAALIVAVGPASLAPSAGAQPPRPPRIPEDAPVVAGPTASGARLLAFDRGHGLCTVLLEPRVPRRFAYPDCERPLLQLRLVNLSGTSDRRRSYHYGLVRPQVASAELVFGARTARAETSEGAAYTGRYAGKVRFLLIEARERARHFDSSRGYLRLFDAGGALLAIANRFAFEPVRERPAMELARGTTSGAPWSLRAFRQRSLAPLPGNEERFVDQPCVEVWRPGPGRGGRSLAKACRDPDNSRDRDSYVFEQHCGRIGYAAVGTVEPDVRRIVAVLGDGRVRRVPLRPLPATHGPGRGFALVLGKNTAVRRLVALREGGGREVLDRSRAPGAVRCVESSVLIAFYDDEPIEPTGPMALTVYDDGPHLCATLGRPTREPGECRHPPLDPYESHILSRRSGDRHLLAGVVPSEVTRAVVELADGRRIAVDTSAEGFYTGQYAGRLRFFTLELPRRQRVSTIRLYDAGGTRLIAIPSDDRFTPSGPPRVVVGGPPGLRLRARRFGAQDPFGGYLCVGLGRGDCEFASTYGVNLRAECNPRRLVVWGVLARGETAFTVETDRGDVEARVRPIPRPLRDRPGAGPRFLRRYAAVSAFVAVLPARARPTVLVVSGRRSSRRAIQLPPASAQCGYEDDFL